MTSGRGVGEHGRKAAEEIEHFQVQVEVVCLYRFLASAKGLNRDQVHAAYPEKSCCLVPVVLCLDTAGKEAFSLSKNSKNVHLRYSI